MANANVPDTLIFKALVREVQEFEPYVSGIETLEYMCDESKYMADLCENYFFVEDEDRKLTDDEAYLLDWLRTMEQRKADDLRYSLREAAIALKGKGY